MAVTSEGIILPENLSETKEQKEAPIVQTGETITMTNNQITGRTVESLTQNTIQIMDGIESLNEIEEIEFDDYCEVDYDLDYTVQY